MPARWWIFVAAALVFPISVAAEDGDPSSEDVADQPSPEQIVVDTTGHNYGGSGVDLEGLHEGIKKRTDHVRNCVIKALSDEEGQVSVGVVKVEVSFTEHGRILKSEVRGPNRWINGEPQPTPAAASGPVFERCMQAEIRRWPWPSESDGGGIEALGGLNDSAPINKNYIVMSYQITLVDEAEEDDEVDTATAPALASRVLPEAPSVQGALDKSLVQRVVRQHLRELQHCYELRLRHDPTLSGRVVFMWVIANSGEVVSAKVEETTIDDSEFDQCLVQRIRQWRFPSPKGGGIVRVSYPFTVGSSLLDE